MTHVERQDGRRLRGQRTREAVLDAAVALASVEGLDGLSLGRLADSLGVSKSGLFTHWKDKQRLQLDAVDWASRQWRHRIVRPARQAPPGVLRLLALHEARLAFYAADVLPGGCFFATVKQEFDDRPGPVQRCIAEAIRDWQHYIVSLAEDAIARGELRDDVDAEQLAFEIDALGEAVCPNAHLLGRANRFTHSRRAVLERLRVLCPDPSILPES